MKKIIAYTIHSIGGNKKASVIYNEVDGNGETTGMNNRAEILIEGNEMTGVEKELENYINMRLTE